MTQLISLVYRSNAKQLLSPAALDEILRSAREANAEVGVTGVLLYRDATFVQYLEGLEPDIDATFDRISAASQHDTITILQRCSIEKRLFPIWLMGFEEPPKSLMQMLYNALWRGELQSRLSPDDRTEGMQLLIDFWFDRHKN